MEPRQELPAKESPPFEELTLPKILYQPVNIVRELQGRLLRRTLDLCYSGHPYYRRVMRDEGLRPEDFQTIDDLRKLPLTRKEDFMARPDEFRLRAPELPLEERILWNVMYTTGTTSGRPSPIYNTTWDQYAYLYHAALASEIAGIRESDTIGNVLPLTPYPMGVYIRSEATAAATGAAIVTVNPGRMHPSFPVHRRLDEAIRLVARHRVTVLWGIASFIRRLLARAVELNADLSSVRICSISGEATSKAMREEMRKLLIGLGAEDPTIVNRYGSTEIGSLLECVEGSGWHNPTPDQTYFEVVDQRTAEPLGDREQGLLLATHLVRRGTILLRYQVGDLVSMTDEVCPHCGRTSERIVSQPYRTKDLVKVKGMLVNVHALKEELEKVRGVGEYQVVVEKSDKDDPFSMDELIVRVAPATDSGSRVIREVFDRTMAATQIRPRIEVMQANEIFDPVSKAKHQHFIDQRPAIQ